MTPKQDETSSLEERLDDLGRVLIVSMGRDHSAQEIIEKLSKAGMRQARIARLTGSSPGYVSVALARANKGSARRKRAKPKG